MVQAAGGAGSTFACEDGGAGWGGSSANARGVGAGASATGQAHDENSRATFATARVRQEGCQECCIAGLSHARTLGANKGAMAWHIAVVTSSLVAAPSKMITDGSWLARAR
jgi:hypothetical protein